MAENKNTQANKEIEKTINDNKKTQAEKTLEEAQKSLTNAKKNSKTKQTSIKGMTAYQEQVLQGATKSKGNKKVLIILLVLLLLAGLVGGGIALFFVLKPKPDESSAIVCDVRVLSYSVQHNVDPEKYEVLNDEYDEFHFTKDTEKTSHFTKDLVATLTDIYDISLVYVVNNISGKEYVYSLNFEDLTMRNCVITVKTSLNGEPVIIDDTRRVVELKHNSDITLELRISVIDLSIANEDNTGCDGDISLTLSVE